MCPEGENGSRPDRDSAEELGALVDKLSTSYALSLSSDEKNQIVTETQKRISEIRRINPSASISPEVIMRGALESAVIEKKTEEFFPLYTRLLDNFEKKPKERLPLPIFKKDVGQYLKQKQGKAPRDITEASEKGFAPRPADFLINRLIYLSKLGLKPGMETNRGVVSSIDKFLNVFLKENPGAHNPFSLEKIK